MPRPRGSIFFVFVLSFLPLVINADNLDDAIGAQESQGEVCPKQATLVPLADERGSVGLMKNLAEHPESMRAVAEKLLKSAVDNTEFLACLYVFRLTYSFGDQNRSQCCWLCFGISL